LCACVERKRERTCRTTACMVSLSNIVCCQQLVTRSLHWCDDVLYCLKLQKARQMLPVFLTDFLAPTYMRCISMFTYTYTRIIPSESGLANFSSRCFCISVSQCSHWTSSEVRTTCQYRLRYAQHVKRALRVYGEFLLKMFLHFCFPLFPLDIVWGTHNMSISSEVRTTCQKSPKCVWRISPQDFFVSLIPNEIVWGTHDMSKETSVCQNRPTCVFQKRPVHVPKQTYACVKQKLFWNLNVWYFLR